MIKFMEEIKNVEDNLVEPSKFDRTKLMVPGAIILAGMLISASVIYSNGGFDNFAIGKFGGAANINDTSLGPKDVSSDDDAFLGDKDASVVLIEFSDYQCPFCRSFWRDTLPLIKSEYIDTGKATFVYRDFPLSFHPGAMPAAQATECAEEQGKFWEMHDKIFSEQDKQGTGTIQFDGNDVKKWAGGIGLNMDEFNSCFGSQKYDNEIAIDLKDGQAAGVSGTPTLFINGKSVVGAQPFSVFKSLIEAELNK